MVFWYNLPNQRDINTSPQQRKLAHNPDQHTSPEQLIHTSPEQGELVQAVSELGLLVQATSPLTILGEHAK